MADHDAAVKAGHISFEQEEGMAGRTGSAPLAGSRAIEVLGYFGAVALAVATLVLTFDIAFGEFDLFGLLAGDVDNVPAGIVALIGAAVVLAFGTRLTAGAGAVQRSGGFTLLAGWGLAAVAFGLLLMDLDVGDATPLVQVLPMVAVALFVWFRAPSVPTQLALWATTLQVVSAIVILLQIQEPENPAAMVGSVLLGGGVPELDTAWATLAIGFAVGVAWIWLGHRGLLRTRNSAFALGAFYAWINAIQLFDTADGWVVLSIALAIAFAWAAMRWQSSVLGGFATVAVVVLIVQIISIVTDEPTATTFELAYGIPGVLAIAGALWMTRNRPRPMVPAMPTPPPAPAPVPAVTPPAPQAATTAVARAATARARTTTTAAKKATAKKTTTTAKKTTTTAKKTTTTAKKATTAKKTTTAKKPAAKKTTR